MIGNKYIAIQVCSNLCFRDIQALYSHSWWINMHFKNYKNNYLSEKANKKLFSWRNLMFLIIWLILITECISASQWTLSQMGSNPHSYAKFIQNDATSEGLYGIRTEPIDKSDPNSDLINLVYSATNDVTLFRRITGNDYNMVWEVKMHTWNIHQGHTSREYIHNGHFYMFWDKNGLRYMVIRVSIPNHNCRW